MLKFLSLIMVMSLSLYMVCELTVLSSMMFFLIMMNVNYFNWFNTSTMIELNTINYPLILLTIWLILMCHLSTNKKDWMLKIVTNWLFLFLMLSFLVSDMIWFYISFEGSLVPIFIMIIGWGTQPERLMASMYMFMYTLGGSLPLFYMLLILKTNFNSNYMYALDHMISNNPLFFLLLIIAFLVKFPMYGVHLWLLKAHVEAPVQGSMILAGVLLKLGGYGLMRIIPFYSTVEKISSMIMVLSLWGGALMAIECIRFMDMKMLIAASSVVHMSGCISALLSYLKVGLNGVMMMMVSHGLCSSGLFYMANIVYLQTKSRSLLVCKGMMSLMPSLTMWWFLLCSANMAAPPSVNLISEIFIMNCLVSWEMAIFLCMWALPFFSAVFSIYLFYMSQHGVGLKTSNSIISNKLDSHMVMLYHWAPIMLITANLNMLLV